MKQAWRNLRRDWIFSTVAIAILAIGVAANTSVFTLINTILFKPLPYREPAGLVHLEESLPDLIKCDYRSKSRVGQPARKTDELTRNTCPSFSATPRVIDLCPVKIWFT